MNMNNQPLTLAHVTHEAVEHIGGIGTVLHGLLTSPVYQERVKRSILVGPCNPQISSDPESRLGEGGTVLYSSIDGIDRNGMANQFHPIEWAFDVGIIYGTREVTFPGHDHTGEAEVLLIDVFRTNPDRLAVFKLRLWETFGLACQQFEKEWEFEEYVRLAQPAFFALLSLLDRNDPPCVLFSHEFMGMPTALAAILDGQDAFRTVFHAHECATARYIVERHPGHDTSFYNILKLARQQSQHVSDAFGDLDFLFRHQLIRRSHLCDGIIAVGDRTKDELGFLDSHFDDHPIDLVYNGLPAFKVTLDEKLKSRQMLMDYARVLLGYEPDVLMSHVTRPVISKALWRDLQVCDAMEAKLKAQGKRAVLFLLTSGGGVRRPQDVLHMERTYGWPMHHREGYPDLVGPEVGINRDIEKFNATHEHVHVVLVNQFGWSRKLIGNRLPREMDIADLRRATDVEFGMAVYEPFGISPLEPLGSGAICVISDACGCAGFALDVTQGHPTDNVIVADYTELDITPTIDQLQNQGAELRDPIEHRVAEQIADQLMQTLPADDAAREKLIESGQTMVAKMGWDQVVENRLLPMLERVMHAQDTNER